MQYRARLGRWMGAGAAGLVVLFTFGTLAAVALRADGIAGLSSRDWAVIRFTVLQAAISAGLSVILAVPLARALMRRRFRGRALLVALLGAPFILPVIVAVMGLIAIFGRSGVLNQVSAWAGFAPINIYGMHGVILAHVFFNLPLVTRLFLQGWQSIPAERYRLAAVLGISGRAHFWLLEWPMLRGRIPGAFLVIFLICTTSFAVALTLGGGPRATTIELAIYQAFRFDFDLGRAALLGVVQFAVGGLAAMMAFLSMRQDPMGVGLDRTVQVWSGEAKVSRVLDALVITGAVLFLLGPLSAVIFAGVSALPDLTLPVFAATLRSLGLALVSTGLALIWALPMALWIIGSRLGGIVEAIGYLSIAASPLGNWYGAVHRDIPVCGSSDSGLAGDSFG